MSPYTSAAVSYLMPNIPNSENSVLNFTVDKQSLQTIFNSSRRVSSMLNLGIIAEMRVFVTRVIKTNI